MSAHREHIRTLGTPRFPSPIAPALFVSEDARVLNEIELPRRREVRAPRFFEVAGPRAALYFDGPRIRVGILTAGGVCPGINDVIRALL